MNVWPVSYTTMVNSLFRKVNRKKKLLLLVVLVLLVNPLVLQLYNVSESHIGEKISGTWLLKWTKPSSFPGQRSFHGQFSNGSVNIPQDAELHSRNASVDCVKSPTLSLDKLEWVDWNNYTLMEEEAKRSGLGEHGVAVTLSGTGSEQKKQSELMDRYKFNAYVSDHISLERSIGDLRTAMCKKQLFLQNIPENSVSVVSVFHNEKNSSLLRTLHSVVRKSPASLLREIILVDDCSTNEELMAPLDDYIRKHFSKVKIVRSKKRLGLIRSRIVGADASTGDFLVFLDAHVEVNYNYLPPLLEPMVLSYRTIVCPMVDFIDSKTLMISRLTERVRGGFDWEMGYKRLPPYPMDETTPHPSPVMVGCAFAITRQWWEELGKYDPGLQIWGAEQYEISFKSWQCGGSVVDAPCSRVAHLFRALPYVKDVVGGDVIEQNFLRLATVWMDEFKDKVMQRRPLMHRVDTGNITQQLELRKRLKCKSFKWFITEVAPDILRYYPLVTPPSVARGKIQSQANNSLCVKMIEGGLSMADCSGKEKVLYDFNWRLHIQVVGSNRCFANPWGSSVFMFDCLDFEQKPTQLFAWNRHSGQIANFYTRLCLDFDEDTFKVSTKICDKDVTTQRWVLSGVNVTLADSVWAKYEQVVFQYPL